MISYIFHYLRMDLRAAYFSPNHAVAGIVTFDPWRSYRLKTPSFAFYVLTVLAPMLIFIKNDFVDKFKWLLMTSLLIYIWILVSHISMAASLIAATLAYHFFFTKNTGLVYFSWFCPRSLSPS